MHTSTNSSWLVSDLLRLATAAKHKKQHLGSMGWLRRVGMVLLHTVVWTGVLMVPFMLARIQAPFESPPLMPWRLLLIVHLGAAAVFYVNFYLLTPRLLERGHWRTYAIACLALVAGTVGLTMPFVVLLTPEDFQPPPLPHAGGIQPFLPLLFLNIMAAAVSTSVRLLVQRVESDRLAAQRDAERLRSELGFLRSQISPHFLFNVLNSLVSLARRKSDQLEPVILQLSDLLRYMLYSSNKPVVTLSHELRYLQDYLRLQQMRFSSQVDLDLRINTDSQPDLALAPMLLLPLVENAYKHGTGFLTPKPHIQIVAEVSDQHFRFRVQNTVSAEPRMEANLEGSGIGLANVRRRLELLYPGQATLLVQPEPNQFTVVLQLNLPLQPNGATLEAAALSGRR